MTVRPLGDENEESPKNIRNDQGLQKFSSNDYGRNGFKKPSSFIGVNSGMTASLGATVIEEVSVCDSFVTLGELERCIIDNPNISNAFPSLSRKVSFSKQKIEKELQAVRSNL